MADLLPIPRFPLPDDWQPPGLICVKVVIPDDPQYLAAFTGLIDQLTWSKNFARDATGQGAATVSRTWQAAIESQPIQTESCMPVFRINEDTCLLEVDCGDGNWRPVFTPDYDPSTDGEAPVPYPEPPPAGQSNQCLAAANAAFMLKTWGDEWATEMGSGLPFMGLVALLVQLVQLLMTLTIGIFTDKVTQAIATLDPDTIDEDFALITQQDIQDVLVCFYDEDGVLQPDMYGNLIDALAAKIPENQGWYLIRMFVEMVGFVGMTLAAKVAGITEADCEGCCEWSHTFDFTVDNGGFSENPSFPYGAYSGAGWGTEDAEVSSIWRRGIDILRSIPGGGQTTWARLTYSLTLGTFVPTGQTALVFEVGDTQISKSDLEVVEGTDVTVTLHNITGSGGIRLGINASARNDGAFYDGAAVITQLELCGNGENPFI